MDKETIKRARQANLAEYLLTAGVPLVKNGKRYKHKEHDSLVFTENSYFWNSRQEHGNSIDYLVKHMNMSFKNAVSALTNISIIDYKQKVVETFELDSETLCRDNDKIKKYLNKTRFIGYGVINHLIENKLLFQEVNTNNAVFPMYDVNNNCVGTELQGIIKKRFKGIKANSKYGYGFNVKFSNDNTYDYALFFESAVDLMSFIDYKMNHEKKSLNRCILISMAGLKKNIVEYTLKAFKSDLKLVLCVDNDKAGQEFKNAIKDARIDYIDCPPDERHKDWNEQLEYTKRNSKAISRLFNKQSLTGNNINSKSKDVTEQVKQPLL